MPRRSLFCVSAPTGLVHWYQPRLGGAHLRPRVRTRRSTERGGGRDSGKARSWRCLGCLSLRRYRAYPSNAGCLLRIRKCFTARSLQCGRVRGARASKTRRRGVNQRTVEFLGGPTRFFGFLVCYLGRNHPSSHLPGQDRLRHISADGRKNGALFVIYAGKRGVFSQTNLGQDF